MKRLLAVLFCLLASAPMLFAFSGSGSGTSGDPYLVSTAALLDEVRNDLTAYYKQTVNIDISSISNWTKIGTSTTVCFSGTYDGDGHKITGLSITSTTDLYNGLFGVIGSGGTVKNLGVTGASLSGSTAGLGILAGYNFGGTVENCYTTGAVTTSHNNPGGLLGSSSGTVTKCYSTATVTATGATSNNVGGLIGAGLTAGGSISQCYSTGNVSNNNTSGNYNTGGFIGMATHAISNCYCTGNVSSSAGGRAGGFIGGTGTGTPAFSYCYSTGLVTCTTKGGFVGYVNTGSFSNCFFDYETAGTSTACGTGTPSGTITAYSTTQMKTASTYSGWNTSYWNLVDGSYPTLKAFYSAPTITFTNGANAGLNFVQTNAIPSQSNWLLGQFSLAGDATGATLNSVVVALAGTYDSGDLASTPFQLYASNTNNFSGASAVGSSVADPGSGNDVTFSSLSDAIPSGTRYYWVTADISATATADDNINGTISDAGDLSISGGTLGTSNYGKLNAGTDASLPVSLVSFSARSEGRSVILEWITESETDNLGFILERSENTVWTQIATYQTHDALKGQGNTSSRTEYTFTDENVESGKAYSYRLSDVSTKGKITVYSSLTITTDELPETTELEKAYPNPFNPQTYIAYNLSEDTDVSITVFDLLGRNVKSLYTGHQLAGSYNVYWNATDETGNKVPSGGYIIQMKTEKSRLTQKVMLMK